MVTAKESETMGDGFLNYKAVAKLRELAAKPFDLSKAGNLTPLRIEEFCAASCGYEMLYGTERVTNEVMDALAQLASEANVLSLMERMQNGEVLNFIKGFPSENRAVLHTATRDFFENRKVARPAREAAEMAWDEVQKLKTFMNKIEAEKTFTDLIMIGIGGSDLGPYANYLGVEYLKKPGRNVYFINNVDPDNAADVLLKANLERSLVVVVSKSGGTLETATNAAFVRSRFVEAGLKPKQHFVSVTGEGSPMDDTNEYLESFYIWDWIGGRYSSTSMVGGVVLAFAFGFDVYFEFLRGANAMDQAALNSELTENMPLMGALLSIWNHNFLGSATCAIIPYSNALRRFSAHIQQLSMESNGKHIDRFGNPVSFQTGEIIWGEPGTNAQHSFYQLLHQGTEIVPIEFIGFKESQHEEDFLFQGTTSQEKLLANLFAQAIGLATGKESDNPNKQFVGNRPSHIIIGKRLTPFALGALLSYFEHKVAFQGFIWNINSFDQEGVQLGKKLADQIIDRFAAHRGLKEAEEYPLGDTCLELLNDLD